MDAIDLLNMVVARITKIFVALLAALLHLALTVAILYVLWWQALDAKTVRQWASVATQTVPVQLLLTAFAFLGLSGWVLSRFYVRLWTKRIRAWLASYIFDVTLHAK